MNAGRSWQIVSRHMVWALLAGACGGGTAASYGGAAMMAAGGVVQTAVYRKVSGYPCWAACQQGYYCEMEAGTCLPILCGGRCLANQRCEKRGEVEVCVEPTRKEQEPAEGSMCGVPDASILLRVPCDAGAD